MLSKGVNLFLCNVGLENEMIVYEPDDSSDTLTSPIQPSPTYTTTKHYEIDSDYIWHTGKVQLLGKTSSGVTIFQHSFEVDAFTGGISGSMDNMLENQQLVFDSNGQISYGLYNSGPGYGDLAYTSHHQCYAYSGDLTRPDWMKTTVRDNPDLGNMPFSVFVLPGAHDSGMNTDTNIAKMANNIAGNPVVIAALLAIFNVLGAVVATIAAFSVASLRRVFVDLAVTQKDHFASMLNMGTRYFDFRPGHNAVVKGIQLAPGDGLYHQHLLIPGAAFTDFLSNVVDWLKEHDGEIVVVNLNFAGFYDKSAMAPSADDLQAAIDEALEDSGIVAGSIADSGTSYNDLIAAGKRLLFFNQGTGFAEAAKSDSYSDSAYGTLTSDSIVSALKAMPQTPPSGKKYTVLQLQATATNALSNTDWVTYAGKLIASGSNACSPLLMTKAHMDNATYAWAAEAVGAFDSAYPVVLLNDFVDPALSRIAQAATLERTTHVA